MRWTLACLSLAFALGVPALGETIQPTLIRARAANPADFPASVWTRSCTATVVGPQVVFIAAHCVSSGTVQFTAGPNSYSATCRVSREYRNNPTADYALCETEKVVSGIAYESVNLDPNLLKVGDEILLSGYGCIRAGGGGGNDGTYRIGESRIATLPRGTSNDIVTNTGAALCFGDSGGPAFWINKSTGARRVISTNSRGDISRESFLSATHTEEGRRFFSAWAELTGKKICGLHNDAQGCRGGGTAPKPNQFRIDDSLVTIDATMKPGQEPRLEEVKAAVKSAIDGLP